MRRIVSDFDFLLLFQLGAVEAWVLVGAQVSAMRMIGEWGGGGGGGEGEINPLAGAGAHNSHAYRAYNTVFLRTSLFLDTFWGTFPPKIELHMFMSAFEKEK